MKKLLAALFVKNGRHSQSRSGNDLSARIHGRDQFLQMIEMERHRVDRGNQQFSLILFNVDLHRNQGPSLGDLASLIRRRVRRIDLVGCYDICHVGVMLPNTSAAGAQRVAKIIAEDLYGNQSGMASSMHFRTLSYPDFGDLEQPRT